MKKLILLSILVLLIEQTIQSQTNDSIKKEIRTVFSDLSKQSLKNKPGIEKDILPNLYQMALKNIFGKDGELSFSSTLFGLASSINKKIEIDTVFSKLQWARNISFSLNAKMDSTNKVTTYGGALNFAIINKRDINVSDKKLNEFLAEIETKIVDIKGKIKGEITDGKSEEFKGKRLHEIDSAYDKYQASKDTADLDREFRKILREEYGIKAENGFLFQTAVALDKWKEQIKGNALWTIGFDYKHNSVLKLDTTTIKSDFLVNIRQKNETAKPWEFAAATSLKLYSTKDTAAKKHNTNAFHAEAGVNKILLLDEDGASRMELKLFAGFDKDFAVKKNKSVFTANATYRFKAFGDFWIPITFSYDPKKGTVFGFATLTFNLDNYGKNKKQAISHEQSAMRH